MRRRSTRNRRQRAQIGHQIFNIFKLHARVAGVGKDRVIMGMSR